MNMGTELTSISGGGLVPDLGDLGVSKYGDDKNFGAVSSGANWLPRLMLMGANSAAVKEQKIGMGRYAFVKSKDQIEDLTPECPILALAWRPKAMDLSDEENIVTVYNPENPEFVRISSRADSGESDTGCMYGPEFLVWVPAVRTFASFFMSSKTARREAPQLKALLKRPALLKCQLIKGGKFMWHGPVVTMYSQPLSDLPSIEEIRSQVQRFNNPPEIEAGEAAPEDDRAR